MNQGVKIDYEFNYLPIWPKLGVKAKQSSLATVAENERLAASELVATDGETSNFQFTPAPQSLSLTLFAAVHASSTAASEVPSSPEIDAPT